MSSDFMDGMERLIRWSNTAMRDPTQLRITLTSKSDDDANSLIHAIRAERERCAGMVYATLPSRPGAIPPSVLTPEGLADLYFLQPTIAAPMFDGFDNPSPWDLKCRVWGRIVKVYPRAGYGYEIPDGRLRI